MHARDTPEIDWRETNQVVITISILSQMRVSRGTVAEVFSFVGFAALDITASVVTGAVFFIAPKQSILFGRSNE